MPSEHNYISIPEVGPVPGKHRGALPRRVVISGPDGGVHAPAPGGVQGICGDVVIASPGRVVIHIAIYCIRSACRIHIEFSGWDVVWVNHGE